MIKGYFKGLCIIMDNKQTTIYKAGKIIFKGARTDLINLIDI